MCNYYYLIFIIKNHIALCKFETKLKYFNIIYVLRYRKFFKNMIKKIYNIHFVT